MRKFILILAIVCTVIPGPAIQAQVVQDINSGKENLNVSRDSMIQLIRMKDSLLHLIRRDSANMANLIVKLEFNRDSLNSALYQSIYRQKVDSADRMRQYLVLRDFNRRSRQELYNPIGIIDKDSVRSSMKQIVDVVFEDTAFSPKPLLLKSSIDRLVYHLNNDSVFLRIINDTHDTIPFVLKKNKIDSTAFFVMNSKKDSAKLYMSSLGQNLLYMRVGDDLNLKHLLKKTGGLEEISIDWPDKSKYRVPRRVVPVPPAKLWFLRSELSLSVNQNTYLNWARGGNNNIAFTTDVKAWANYAKKTISWTNSFWFVYGLQKTELLSLRKSADRVFIVSNLSQKAFKNFDYTLGSTFETQGFRGYAYPNDSVPVSKFMAPADLKINLGMTFKPNPKLTVNFYPVGGQFRFVLDTALIDQTKFGLKADQRMNAQLVARIIFNHSTVLFKNISMTNFLDLTSNYIDHPEKINFNWRLGLSLKVNKYISTSINTEMLYDNRTLIPLYEIQDGKKVKVGEGKRIQFSELFGVTFKYAIY
jgi:hypothetical protein